MFSQPAIEGFKNMLFVNESDTRTVDAKPVSNDQKMQFALDVVSVTQKEEQKPRPQGLDTVYTISGLKSGF